MTKQQQNAVEYIRKFVTERMAPRSGDIPFEVSKFEVEQFTPKTISVAVATDLGTPGTLLRSLSHEFWVFFVGPKGAIEIMIAPKSMLQFKGKRAFRMNVSHRLSC